MGASASRMDCEQSTSNTCSAHMCALRSSCGHTQLTRQCHVSVMLGREARWSPGLTYFRVVGRGCSPEASTGWMTFSSHLRSACNPAGCVQGPPKPGHLRLKLCYNVSIMCVSKQQQITTVCGATTSWCRLGCHCCSADFCSLACSCTVLNFLRTWCVLLPLPEP
jgi:hypothetical protein